jgi:peptidoglycan lytic transglycosylase
MKRWLAALAVFAACACHVDIAAADTRSPTLWQRIVSVFAPRPAIRHPSGPHLADSAQKAAATAKPTEVSPGAGAPPQPADERQQFASPAPESDRGPAARPVEMLPVAASIAASAPQVASPPVAPAKAAHKRERHENAKAQFGTDTTAALSPSAPATVEPTEPPSTVAPDTVAPGAGTAAFKPTKKAKRKEAAPGYELASIGSPGLKPALAPDDVQSETPARSYDGAFPAAPSRGSVCNVGRKVVTAYYWEGSHTASGQPFNPHAMTAAHRTLPFGTHLNVTNPRTGKSVEVIVNDRGPYTSGVGLDLSLGAAQAIGLHGTGSVCIL